MSDALLLQHFSDAVHGVFPTATSDIVTRVHGILLTKIYNARNMSFCAQLEKFSAFAKKGSRRENRLKRLTEVIC